jgi:signal transduction histidine kinase
MRTIDDTMEKVSFVNQVSHELKTPLTNIRLYAEMLKESLSHDERSLKKIEVIEAESQRLSRMIRNALTFSNSALAKPNKKTVDVENVLTNVMETFRPSLERKQVVVDMECAVKEAEVDVDMLEQIVINLVSNVEKYGADGKYLGVRAYSEHGRLHVRVQDKGKGVPEKFRKKIFEPFFRARNTTTEGVSGTGIGLSLSRSLAEKHGGSLRLMPTDGGACFEVIL